MPVPDLNHSLYKHDLGFLRIVASLWGVDLVSVENEKAAQELAGILVDPDLVNEILDSLSPEAVHALADLVEAGGKIPWALFSRNYGDLREAGPGKRDREKVYLLPVTTTEILHYRALLDRAFFDSPSGLLEYAYVPVDFMPFLQNDPRFSPSEEKEIPSGFQLDMKGDLPAQVQPMGHPAVPNEYRHIILASDTLLDDAVTYLVALRIGSQILNVSIDPNILGNLLRSAGIVAGNDPEAEKVKSFLEIPRQGALAWLEAAWQKNEDFNELRLMPDLLCEGEWQNSPGVARAFVNALMNGIPKNKWWSLPALIRDVKEKYPDFQRPAGDYDSWFIKRSSDGTFLRGFSSWDEVDGALIRYIITSPMFWLGKVDLASAQAGGQVTAFRLREKPVISKEAARMTVSSTGKIVVPRCAPRVARYQVSRFCEWEEVRQDEYRYRVTVQSLKKAGEQGLKVNQLLSMLAKNSAAEIPPAFVQALKRWESHGTEARMERQLVLVFNRPETILELRRSKAGRFLGEVLGPAAVVVKPGAEQKIQAALLEMGLLIEVSPLLSSLSAENKNPSR